MELRDVTLWKLTLKNFKLGDNTNKANVRAQLQALEYCPREKEKKKEKQAATKRVIKKKIKK